MIDVTKIEAGIRKLFNIKRFASIEFTAKQAFENLNMAIVYAQIVLAVLILLFVVGGIFWLRRAGKLKKLSIIKNNVELLFHMLLLLEQEEALGTERSRSIEKSYQETLEKTVQLIRNSGMRKALGDYRHQLVHDTLAVIRSKKVTHEEQLGLLSQTAALLSSV